MIAAIQWTPLQRMVALVAAIVALGCGRPATSPPVSAPPTTDEISAPRIRTTDGELATHNFQAELALAERQHIARPADLARTRALVDRLFIRAQFFGKLTDYDEAEILSKAEVVASPQSGDAHLLLARSLTALHEFDQARLEVERAAVLGGEPDSIQHVRAGIWAATGDIDRALVYLTAWRHARPNLPNFAAEAGARADKHDFALAESLFSEAKRHYDDVSPFAVAWLEFQEGHMWETAGRSDRARPLFESALARLPGYAPAAAHLARLEAAFDDPRGRERARALLEPLVARTDDPEYIGDLGALYRQMHQTADGDRLIQQATRGYEMLIARHPAAFYDHAARFFLHVGGDSKRALDFAQRNLAVRHTPDARDLLAEAERATKATSSLSR